MKDYVIRARVTEQEKNNYEILANELNMSVSELIRDTLNRRFINRRMGGTYGLEDFTKPKEQTAQIGDRYFSKLNDEVFTILSKNKTGYSIIFDSETQSEIITFNYMKNYCKRV